MPKVFTSEKQKVGEIGENMAVKFLVKHKFVIKERNYTKKWGEIDIIAQKQNKLYFIEVKSVVRENLQNIIRETPNHNKIIDNDEYRPEDNMHPWKMRRLARTIQTYLASNKIEEDMEWQTDLLIVYLDLKNKKARIKTLKDIILG